MPRQGSRRPGLWLAEELAIRELHRIREPLMRELARLSRNPDYYKGQPPHRCCTRDRNRMRISPLEARAIARAFRTDRGLERKLPRVLERLRADLRRLEDNDERQSYDCPLLDGTRCLVHEAAKPIGCAAWHPPEPGQDAAFTGTGWRAFEQRDMLNDRLYGPHWKLRVIPLWLKRVFAPELARASRSEPSKPRRPRGRAHRK